MKRLSSCSIGGTGLALLASLALGSWAYGQCANDAGVGDLDEAEACYVDNDVDATNPGCNADVAVFTTLATTDFTAGVLNICGVSSTYLNDASCDVDADCDDLNCVGDPNPGDGEAEGTCVGPSEPTVSTRDTDWYLIPQSVLADHDADANGVVTLNSQFTGSESQLVNFHIGITPNGTTCDSDILTDTGCWAIAGAACDIDDDCHSGTCVGDPIPGDGNPQGICSAQDDPATNTVIIADYPDGIAVWTGIGFCSGGGDWGNPDYFCSTGNNDHILKIWFTEAPTNCKPGPPQGPCNEAATPGVAGCEDPNCCALVCQQPGLAFCCLSFWSQACASAAIDLGCAPEPGGPVNMATGPDEDQVIDGYLRVKADPYGAFAAAGFGGTPGGGDFYNPAGDDNNGFGVDVATFSNGYYFFIAATNQRQILANNTEWQDSIATPDDGDIERAINIKNVEFDTNADGITDRMTSQFQLTGPGVDLTFDLVQQVANPEGAIATLTQTYTITNGLASPITFDMNRQFDGDFVWLPGGSTATDDSTGTSSNGNADYVWVFMQEVGTAATALTHSAATDNTGWGAEYCGAKQFVNPHEADPGCLPYDFGSDTEEWDAFGLPDCWVNHVALVGYNLNGTSGDPAGADDVHTVLVQTVTVPGSGSAVMEILHTYGQQTPYGVGGGEPCPCDCNTTPDGVVNTQDFLAMLAQWGGPGSCDCAGDGDGNVDTTDFLAILAAWGDCP
ncbi:MAG: hypothetical protein ACYTGF_05910 [Planctomycetota bacterium]|jgi:hypothetical protein